MTEGFSTRFTGTYLTLVTRACIESPGMCGQKKLITGADREQSCRKGEANSGREQSIQGEAELGANEGKIEGRDGSVIGWVDIGWTGNNTLSRRESVCDRGEL